MLHYVPERTVVQAYCGFGWSSWCWKEHPSIRSGTEDKQIMASEVCCIWLSSGTFRCSNRSSNGWVPFISLTAWCNGGDHLFFLLSCFGSLTELSEEWYFWLCCFYYRIPRKLMQEGEVRFFLDSTIILVTKSIHKLFSLPVSSMDIQPQIVTSVSEESERTGTARFPRPSYTYLIIYYNVYLVSSFPFRDQSMHRHLTMVWEILWKMISLWAFSKYLCSYILSLEVTRCFDHIQSLQTSKSAYGNTFTSQTLCSASLSYWFRYFWVLRLIHIWKEKKVVSIWLWDLKKCALSNSITYFDYHLKPHACIPIFFYFTFRLVVIDLVLQT